MESQPIGDGRLTCERLVQPHGRLEVAKRQSGRRGNDFCVPAWTFRRPTLINANTASAVVLRAVMDQSEDKVRAVIAAREREPFASADALKKPLDAVATPYVDVKTDYFLALFTVVNGEAAVAGEALIARRKDWPAVLRVEAR